MAKIRIINVLIALLCLEICYYLAICGDAALSTIVLSIVIWMGFSSVVQDIEKDFRKLQNAVKRKNTSER